MNTKKKNIVIGGLVVLLVVLNFMKSYGGSVEKAMDKAGIYYNQILETVETDKGILVFYQRNNYVGVAQVRKMIMGYKLESGGPHKEIYSSEEVDYSRINLGKNLERGNEDNILPLVTGTIMNEEIVKINAIFDNGDMIEGTIVRSENIILWYAILDVPLGLPRVQGLGANGEVIYDSRNR